ncbi:MAG: hypothetical protein ACI9MR_000424 [Myxococcota bacterium]|jgi:hypothetical protein
MTAPDSDVTAASTDGVAPDPLTLRVLQVCDAVGEFIAYWGFKHVHGRVWALLALSRQPRSQADVSRLLGISRALVSTAMHDLRGYGLVVPTSTARNAPWKAVIDVWPTIADVLRQREWIMLERARGALESTIEEAELAGSQPDWDIGRMRILLDLTEMAQRFLKLIVSLRVPKSLGVFGDWMSRATGLIGSLRRKA